MECNAYGFPLPPLKERFDRFDEGIEVLIRLLLAEGLQLLDGKYFTADRRPLRAEAGPAPVPADHHRRQRADAHPARRRPLVRGMERVGPGHPPASPSSRRSCAGTARTLGRDFSTITCSCLLRWGGRFARRPARDAGRVARRGRRPGRHRPADARQAGVAVPARRRASLARVAGRFPALARTGAWLRRRAPLTGHRATRRAGPSGSAAAIEAERDGASAGATGVAAAPRPPDSVKNSLISSALPFEEPVEVPVETGLAEVSAA